MAIDDKNLSYTGVFKKAAYRLYVEYLEKSTTHGMRMIRRTEGDSYGRYIWLAFMVFIFVLTHLDVYRLAIQFMQAPTETRLSPKVVHVKNVLFPAVAICSNNQISKRAINEFSEELFIPVYKCFNSLGTYGCPSQMASTGRLFFSAFSATDFY